MSSQRKIEANRRNAQRSTGPKTQAGKAASSRNATRHGLAGNSIVVLPTEDPDDLDQLTATITAEFKPAGDTEEFFVHQMIAARWKLLRIQRLEAGAYDEIFEAETDRWTPADPDRRVLDKLSCSGNILEKLERYAAAADRLYTKSLRQLLQLRATKAKTEKQNKATEAQIWLQNELSRIKPTGLFADPLTGHRPLATGHSTIPIPPSPLATRRLTRATTHPPIPAAIQLNSDHGR